MDKQALKSILLQAIENVKPKYLIKSKITFHNNILYINDNEINLKKYSNIYVCGAGKASVDMAIGINEILKDRISGGIVISNIKSEDIGNIKVLKGSHPVPDEQSLLATENLCNFLKKIKPQDFLIFLLSGGTSALLEMLSANVTIKEFQNFTDILLRSGMTIQEMNTLRKKISLVKGGKLLNFINCDCICLVLSDVIEDNLRYIGSGPLYLKEDDYDALEILEKYNIFNKIPDKIRNILLKNQKIKLNKKVKHFIIGNNFTFLKNIQNLLKKNFNINTEILTTYLKGEAREVAKVLVSISKFNKGKFLLFGGETTVTVKGEGKGGRNQEMVLSALVELKNEKNFIFASIASDGIDGNSDAAGAIIDNNSTLKSQKLNLNPEKFLHNNDSYNFFNRIGDLITTGSTGTNVLDATVIYIHQ